MTFWMRWLEAFPKSQPEFDDPQFDPFFNPFPRPLGDGVPLAETETAPLVPADGADKAQPEQP